MDGERTTLLIEDNEDHALLAQWALRRNADGWDTVWLRDGEEALRYLEQCEAAARQNTHTPGLILLDINLPKVNGKEILRRIRQCEGLCATPVVMLTTSDDEEDVAECYSLGANSYVIKPVQFDDLSRKLAAIHLYWRDTNRTAG